MGAYELMKESIFLGNRGTTRGKARRRVAQWELGSLTMMLMAAVNKKVKTLIKMKLQGAIISMSCRRCEQERNYCHSGLCDASTNEKRENGNFDQNLANCCQGGGIEQFNVAKNRKPYWGQWECFFWKKRRGDGQIELERGQ